MRNLIVLNALLLSIVGAEVALNRPAEPARAAPNGSAPEAEVAGEPELSLAPDPEATARLDAQPIFFEDRTAPEPEAMAQTAPVDETERADEVFAEEETAPLDAKLVGTLLEGDLSLAVISSGGSVRRVYPGDVVDGWRLESIESHAVTFFNGPQQAELTLERGTGSKDKAAAAQVARQVAAQAQSTPRAERQAKREQARREALERRREAAARQAPQPAEPNG